MKPENYLMNNSKRSVPDFVVLKIVLFRNCDMIQEKIQGSRINPFFIPIYVLKLLSLCFKLKQSKTKKKHIHEVYNCRCI